MSSELLSWLNRIGLILGFFSFWLAAPEILGEDRLKKIEQNFEKTIGCLGWILNLLIIFIVITLGFLSIGPLSSLWLFVVENVQIPGINCILFPLLCFGVVYLLEKILKASRKLLKRFLRYVLSRLTDDNKIRQRSLAYGALLFIVGFIFQLVATF